MFSSAGMTANFAISDDHMQTRACQHCGSEFQLTRKDRRFCKPSCRGMDWQKGAREKNPANSKRSIIKRRDNLELFDSVIFLTETYWKTPLDEKLGWLEALVTAARNGDAKPRAVLTNPRLIDPSTPGLRRRLRGIQSKRTIGQLADKYCRRAWRAKGPDVASGRAPEPPTGECIEEVDEAAVETAEIDPVS